MNIVGKGRLWKQLLRNYFQLLGILVALMITTLILIAVSVYMKYDGFKPKVFAQDIMKNDYKKISAKDIISTRGWVEILDPNYKVIRVIGDKKTNEMKYNRDEFYKMSFDNYAGGYFYTFAYNQKKNFIVAVVYPKKMVEVNYNINGHSPYTQPIVVLIIAGILIFIGALILSIVIFSKITSKKFVVPLEKLSKGALAIADGDYGKQVDLGSFGADNEINDLHKAFNIMSVKLKDEIKLKNKIDRSRRQLILDIAHDLKNPITSAMGYSELLTKENIEIEDIKRYSQIIYNNCKRANSLAINLFEFSHLESEGFLVKLQKLDVCELLREIIGDYIPDLDDKEFIYDFDIPEDGIIANIDRDNMYRALSNIIDNSIKYNEKGTALGIKLKNRLNHNEEKIQIIIEDNGVGIPEKLMLAIFNPFVRVDETRNSSTGGTGLGLAIAKMIIGKHGGDISLESGKGKGCKFVITLPFIKE